MTTAQDEREPTLLDVIEKIDKLSQNQEQFTQNQERFSHDLEQLTQNQERFSHDLGQLTQNQERFSHDLGRVAQDQERFNERFSYYQQATQWVVQLAFTLIASATLTLIITVVLRR